MDATGPRSRRWGPTVLIVATGMFAGCGVDRENDQPRGVAEVGTAFGSTSEPVSAYADWLAALAAHDAATACALQAPELTIELRYEAILADRAELGDPCTRFEALLWEDPEFDSEIVDVAVTQETEEDALLEVHLASADLTVRMVYHRAHWRVFSTAPRSADGSDDAGTGPARWLDAWCELSPDLTRDQVVALMGPPSGEYTVADGGEPQLWWAQDQYDFRVYLDPVDPAGSVLELVGDYDALSADDRALLPCPELRS